MTKTLKKIYLLLMKLIKNAHKVIVSDALINDVVLELLKYRTNEDKIYIVNSYKKFENIEAVKINNENYFLSTIKNKILNGIPFLFPCDSCETITNFYLECLKTAPNEHKDKFILITADSKIKTNDATKELKNKFDFIVHLSLTGWIFNLIPHRMFLWILKANLYNHPDFINNAPEPEI